MFTIHQIKTFFYSKNVFLYISIKKDLAKKIFSKSVTITVYKDNLKPLNLLDVIF